MSHKIKLTLKKPFIKGAGNTAISLFSGAGGDTLGLERASYNVVAYNEYIQTFVNTHEQMFPNSKLLSHNGDNDIRQIPDYVFSQYRGNIDLVFSGFPCQGFSHAGKKKTNDPRNELVYEFVRVVKCVKPKWIIGENVSGLLSRTGVHPTTGQKEPVINIINSLFNEIGYSLTWRIVSAVDFNVPQNRKRLIIIGHDNSKAPINTSYPHIDWNQCMTHNTRATLRPILETTLEGAMEFPKQNIPNDTRSDFWIQTDQIEPPKNNTIHPNLVRLVEGIRNKSSNELAKPNVPEDACKTIVNPIGLISFGRRISPYHGEIVDPDQPSKTIICTYGTCPRLFVGLHNHVTDKYWIRPFTLTELAQIQAFPKDYHFVGNTKAIITQIGNAVPSNIVQNIVTHLKNITFKSHQQNADFDEKNAIVTDDDEENSG